ncbi:alpha/beta hydrolase [Streptomyces chartreusis]
MNGVPRPTRSDIRFGPAAAQCAGWLYMPSAQDPPPLVVLGHGLGATRELRLDAYCERLADAGIAALAFTYRGFGDSGGIPRQTLSVRRQLEDWEAALAYAQTIRGIDTSRVAIWGSSFGGGHAIRVAARHPELVAAVSQCPFTDGYASARARGIGTALRTVPAMIKDLVAAAKSDDPVTVPVVGSPSSNALMVAPDALPGYSALIPAEHKFTNEMTARSAFQVITYRPGRAARQVKVPILFCVSRADSVAPTAATLKHVRNARLGKIEMFDAGHFDFYVGEHFETVFASQLAFLRQQFERVSGVSDLSDTT